MTAEHLFSGCLLYVIVIGLLSLLFDPETSESIGKFCCKSVPISLIAFLVFSNIKGNTGRVVALLGILQFLTINFFLIGIIYFVGNLEFLDNIHDFIQKSQSVKVGYTLFAAIFIIILGYIKFS